MTKHICRAQGESHQEYLNQDTPEGHPEKKLHSNNLQISIPTVPTTPQLTILSTKLGDTSNASCTTVQLVKCTSIHEEHPCAHSLTTHLFRMQRVGPCHCTLPKSGLWTCCTTRSAASSIHMLQLWKERTYGLQLHAEEAYSGQHYGCRGRTTGLPSRTRRQSVADKIISEHPHSGRTRMLG
jgi:hypothetical protein